MSPLSRRQFLKTSALAGVACSAPNLLLAGQTKSRLDRRALVRRHNPVVTRLDPFSALSVGNGEFAFTADVTGLQTFAGACEKIFPLCTAAHWAWHTMSSPGMNRENLRLKNYDTHGRNVGYATDSTGQKPLFDWLRQNPHGLHLGRIGFDLKKSDGSPASPEDLQNAHQTLDLWTGMLESRFEWEGKPVRVQTCCHPEMDSMAVRVESPLLATRQLNVWLAFPYGSPELSMADWTQPERHQTSVQRRENRADFHRTLDETQYHVAFEWSKNAALTETGSHHFLLSTNSRMLEFVCAFSPEPITRALPSVRQTMRTSEANWEGFWEQGGAMDLSQSTDSRAPEIERRCVLSQYNTAIHCAGSLPSAETGLLCNTWYGKFHLEMHWWHSVHFAAWNRFALFERSLGIYERILPIARQTAAQQGYAGARWPKMIGPDGHDSPSSIGPLLIWQQPHPIYYAELCYRQQPTRKTLERWREIVFESAEFMASYAVFVESRNEFVLGPPLKTVSENTDATTATNPAFELAYWRFGLRVAQSWRERLGLPRHNKWERVLKQLAPLPVQNGVYLIQENLPDTYTRWNWEHPAVVGACGMLPGDGVDSRTMHRTLLRVMETWKWDETWGWDYPMLAMCAARVGEPELAIQALLLDTPKNRYLPNGHNFQRADLPAYLPGNGGLLATLAMMCAGWMDGAKTPAPGFPSNGKWSVRAEDLKRCL